MPSYFLDCTNSGAVEVSLLGRWALGNSPTIRIKTLAGEITSSELGSFLSLSLRKRQSIEALEETNEAATFKMIKVQ